MAKCRFASDALMAFADAPPAGDVVHPQSRRVGARHGLVDHSVATEQWDEEGERHDEVRGVLEQDLALVQGLVDEPEVPLLQVPEAPVDKLRGLGRGAGCEVVALHEGRAQAPRGSVESHADTCDPTAYHEDVEFLFREPSQRVFAVHGVSLPQTQTPPSGGSSHRSCRVRPFRSTDLGVAFRRL